MNIKKRSSNNNLYAYLIKHAENKYAIELLQYEINNRVYHYGKHFSSSWEKTPNLKENIKNYLAVVYKKIKYKKCKNSSNLVLSNAYFSINDILSQNNYKVIIPWWNLKKNGFYLKDQPFLKLFSEIEKTLKTSGIDEILSKEFLEKVIKFKELASEVIVKNKIKAGFFSYDLGFFERVFIDALKECGVPSFIFLHGLPNRYNNIDDNRADYLIVWGPKMKQNYIDSGVNAEKIIVSGHPIYSQITHKNLLFSLDKILVISKPTHGTPPISDNIFLSDRGNSILYLQKVERTLKSLGVKNVKLRLHPSENKDWYKTNINTSFFSLDNANLYSSINSSTLLIGPSTTVILDSIYCGVNYLIFEPLEKGFTLMNYPTCSPFNGDDDKIPVAKNESEFKELLNKKKSIDASVIHDYVNSEFDFSEVIKKIGM